MYHKLSETDSDMLTVRIDAFEEHIKFLMKEGYQFLSLSQLIQSIEKRLLIAPKTVLLTFDDGYQDNFDLLLPILKRHNLCASIFLPISFIGKHNQWDERKDTLMDYPTLKQAQPWFEYGIHSFAHKNTAEMSVLEFHQDLVQCMEELKKNDLPYQPCYAYPFGKFPKKRKKTKELQKAMNQEGIKAAFRIGNKVNAWPLKNPYLIKRIDIRGTDSFKDFKTKVAKGKVKMF